ncbi:MAG: type II secretion system protein GspG [Planctomycetota bacterium]|jgi:hypothetical protein
MSAIRFALVIIGCALMSGICAQRIARPDLKKMAETRENMRELRITLRTHHDMHKEYPKTLEDLDGENLTKDAWSNALKYERKDGDYIITSYGSDGKAGGEGANKDILWTSRGERFTYTEAELKKREAERAEKMIEAARSVARLEMTEVGLLALKYYKKNSNWPDKAADLMPTDKNEAARFKACFKDSWGTEYFFKPLPHDNFTVICYGADGKEGGKDAGLDFAITEAEVAKKTTDEDRYDRGYDYECERISMNVQRFKEATGKLPVKLEDLVNIAVEQEIETEDEEPYGPEKEKKEEDSKPKVVVRQLMDQLPKDDFGNEYLLLVSGDDEFHVVGLGKDQKSGGTDDNADTIYPKPGNYSGAGPRRFR